MNSKSVGRARRANEPWHASSSQLPPPCSPSQQAPTHSCLHRIASIRSSSTCHSRTTLRIGALSSENQPTWDAALANKDNPPPPEPELEPPRTPEEALLRKQQEDQAREIVKNSGLEDAARAFFLSEEFQSQIREVRADLLKQHYLRRPKQGLEERMGKRPAKNPVD